MKHLLWGSATVLAFLVGLWLGAERFAPVMDPASATASGVVAPAAAPAVALAVAPAVAPASDGRDGAPGEPPATWEILLARHEALALRGDLAAADLTAQHLLDLLRERAARGDAAVVGSVLDDFLAANPHHGDAHLLASDLQQMQGRSDAAVEWLLRLLRFADDPAFVGRARDRLALLINVQETRLANRGDVAGLIRLFEDLSVRDPVFDGHRLRLAQWLLRAGRLEEADRVLAQTGSVGVDPHAREDLAASLALARSGLPLETATDAAGRPTALHVQASAGDGTLRLLVDTGATTTAVARQRAASLGSRPTGRRVGVRTASGRVEAEVHVLHDVRIGALRLDTLEVLVLDQPLPDGVDGLLGMDVIARFPGLPGTGATALRH